MPFAACPLRAPLLPPEARAVLAFWQAEGLGPDHPPEPALATRLAAHFLVAHEAAARGERAAWAGMAAGSLALALLLDQFPRLAFAGTPRSFATDAAARRVAHAALALAQDLDLPAVWRVFLYLPLGHAEALSDQELCVALSSLLPSPHPEQARARRDQIRRFGRFPARNAVLGRASTAEERCFLAEAG
ncbi:DUF924 family protein [Siccirubricoccus sp. KC 17139]|uniref:DUF924 family protein n=1 Tax=Siccirubricoccus soli TaxID=2899147 RepID=A0ABT1D3T2_9PROT|nr:DUF924 family protein [Siccirubricoccus soli]MCO6415635.1 DUF924 family protein [Siccirubricoccus soli]MCP2681767.1 DUF924 family protein [Siccirubricoccus soli]